jgi:hypothetical protein
MEATMVEKATKLNEKPDETPVQKLARLDAERAEILASAKSDALQKANDAVTELNALGFQYHLSEEAQKAAMTKGKPVGPCSICNVTTNPTHDARSHKKQEPKRAFTDEELKARNLVKVV